MELTAFQDPFSLEPRGQALHGGPREPEHEDVVGRGPQVESYLDPRLCEPARHGQRRVAMNLGRWPVTQSAVGVKYWEGSVRVEGQDAGKPVKGVGYVELTGYAGEAPGV